MDWRQLLLGDYVLENNLSCISNSVLVLHYKLNDENYS